MRDDVRKIMELYTASEPPTPYKQPAEKIEQEDFAKIWVDAVIEADKERKRRERKTDIFRISYGGLECAYKIEDYRAVAEHLSKERELPEGLAVEIDRGAIT